MGPGMATSDFKAKVVGDIPYYQGPNAIRGIRFRTAGRDLGVTGWGMNVIDLEAGCTAYPEHDHAKDGQEEVYVVLKGSGTIECGGEKTALTEGMLVRVGPSTRRKVVPGRRESRCSPWAPRRGRHTKK